MKIHADITLKDMKNENGTQEEIKKSKLIEDEQVKDEKVTNIEKNENTTLPNIEDLRKELLKNNQIYLEKVQMGKRIHETIVNGPYIEEALPKKYKETLKIYRKSNKINLMKRKRKFVRKHEFQQITL